MNKKDHDNLRKYLLVGTITVSVLFIFSAILLSVFAPKEGKAALPQSDMMTGQPEEIQEESENIGVFLGVDTVHKFITIWDSSSGTSEDYTYSGGTDILDKYEQMITPGQLIKGQIVIVTCAPNSRRLTKLAVAKDMWENIGVTELKINQKANIISYLGHNYSFSDKTIIMSGDKVIKLEDLLPIDYVTVRGWQENIYSIVVTAGHGYLELYGQEDFLGGIISIGSQVTQEITNNMKIPVPIGNYTVTVNNKKLQGSKDIVIAKDETTSCNISEFAISQAEEGTVMFNIKPLGAILSIDGKETDYSTPITLAVGVHDIEVSLGGYRAYKGSLYVTEGTLTTSIALQQGTPSIPTQEEEITKEPSDTTPWEDTTTDSDSDTSKEDSSFEDDETLEDTDEEDNAVDEDSESNQTTSGVDANHKITIKWTSGAEVFFNGEYVGTIKDGSLSVPKQYGELCVDLVLEGMDTVTYNILVENNGKDAVFSFPNP